MAKKYYKYTHDMPEKLLAYFQKYFESRSSVASQIQKKGMPTFVKFARENNLSSRTLKKWATECDKSGNLKHPDFAEAYEECKAFIADVIEDGAITKVFDASFAKYLLEGRYRSKDRDYESVEESGIDINLSLKED